MSMWQHHLQAAIIGEVGDSTCAEAMCSYYAQLQMQAEEATAEGASTAS